MLKSLLKTVLPKGLIIHVNALRHKIYRFRANKKSINTSGSIVTFGDKSADTFFGYYDISPFNSFNEIVYLSIPKHSDKANIHLRNLESGEYFTISQTSAWNWQQGSRLRWLPQSDDSIVFNDFIEDKFVARILDVRKSSQRIIPYPIYDISSDAKLAATLNFVRLGNKRPGYGYTNIKFEEDAQKLKDEAILICNLSTDEVIHRITYGDILKHLSIESDNITNCYLNHLSFSPDSSKLLFFMLEIEDGWHKASLLVYELSSKKITVLEEQLKVSHYVWLNNNQIICTGVSLLENKKYTCGYYLYSLDSPRKQLFPEQLIFDGHPSIFGNIMLSDTYPLTKSVQELFLIDMETGKKTTLLDIYHYPITKEEFRTDLHPRLNKTKDLICFDGSPEGYRKLYILKDWK